MVVDKLIEQIKEKKNPCCVGLDPAWNKLPEIYRHGVVSEAKALLCWGRDVIDAVADLVPAVKPQMAFFEMFGWEGVRVHQQLVQYAHDCGLIVVDDSKRNDIGNTAAAYAHAHLAKDGPINADFLTVSPFLGTDSLQPFVEVAVRDGKGLFVLVKTSNPSSVEISEAVNPAGTTVRDWLADYVHTIGTECVGKQGYSSVGAVVGATFPAEARQLRERMPNNLFLVPGFGAQGGGAEDVVPCFCDDGLGALVNSSRGVLYKHLELPSFDRSRTMYMQIVREQAREMQCTVYRALSRFCEKMVY